MESMIKIGLESESFHLWLQNKRMDVFGLIDKAAELGFDGVIINLVPKKNMTEGLGALGKDDHEHLLKVKKHIEKYNLFVELDTRGIDIAHLSRVVEIAHLLGADIVRTFVMSGTYTFGYLAGKYIEGEQGDHLDKSLTELRKLLPLLKKYRVKLAIENHELEIMEEVLELIKALDSPWVGSLLDTGNMMMSWQEPLKAAKLAAPHAITTHIKDHIICKYEDRYPVVGVPLGQGSIDLESIFEELYENSTLTRLNLEQCYPYASRLQRPAGTGGVDKLGEGTFAIKPLPFPDDIAPEEYYLYDGPLLEEMMELQLKGTIASLEYMRNLWRKVVKNKEEL